MAIKASGTALTAMSESAGWVEVDVAAVLSIFEQDRTGHARNWHPRKRVCFSIFLAPSSAATGGLRLKPRCTPCSAECVIHTHPVAANALNCGPG